MIKWFGAWKQKKKEEEQAVIDEREEQRADDYEFGLVLTEERARRHREDIQEQEQMLRGYLERQEQTERGQDHLRFAKRTYRSREPEPVLMVPVPDTPTHSHSYDNAAYAMGGQLRIPEGLGGGAGGAAGGALNGMDDTIRIGDVRYRHHH